MVRERHGREEKQKAGDNKGGVVTCSLMAHVQGRKFRTTQPLPEGEERKCWLIIIRRDDEACADAFVPAPA